MRNNIAAMTEQTVPQESMGESANEAPAVAPLDPHQQLEYKLALLEHRFTQPLPGATNDDDESVATWKHDNRRGGTVGSSPNWRTITEQHVDKVMTAASLSSTSSTSSSSCLSWSSTTDNKGTLETRALSPPHNNSRLSTHSQVSNSSYQSLITPHLQTTEDLSRTADDGGSTGSNLTATATAGSRLDEAPRVNNKRKSTPVKRGVDKENKNRGGNRLEKRPRPAAAETATEPVVTAAALPPVLTTTAPPLRRTISHFFDRSKRKSNEPVPVETGTSEHAAAPTMVSNDDDTAKKLAALQEQCLALEQACQEKEEKLKTVLNNRTIQYATLQASLAQKDAALQQSWQSHQDFSGRTRTVLERLYAQEAERDAAALRQRLANTGARLGRLVHSRAGMRMVETWHEGPARQELMEQRQALQQQRQNLERRQAAAKRAMKQAGARHDKDDGSAKEGTLNNTSPDQEVLTVGGIEIRTQFDAIEAMESVRYHLSVIRKEEKELITAEQKLEDEKVMHIRALKRVSSEDASRFRSRPKASRPVGHFLRLPDLSHTQHLLLRAISSS
jgi:hypothetical protein